MTHRNALATKNGILSIAKENPDQMVREIKQITLPSHHDVKQKDVDIKRLGTILALAQDLPTDQFEDLLLLQGLGPRTLQSLTLVSEVIYGTESRFTDPARFSFAHGGKDGHPFPVPTKVYDESIQILNKAVEQAKLDRSDKLKALKSLSIASHKLEKDFEPSGNLESVIEQERNNSWKYGGRTVMGFAKKPATKQLALF